MRALLIGLMLSFAASAAIDPAGGGVQLTPLCHHGHGERFSQNGIRGGSTDRD